MGTPVYSRFRTALLASVALATLAACDGEGNIIKQDFDWDIRNLGGGFDTTDAARNLANRPRPDDRGVISYPNYQVVVAERGETVRQIATRLNIDANALAAYNGVDADIALRRDEVVALPARVAEPSPATGALTTGPIQAPSVNVTTLASDAIERAGEQTTTPTATTPATAAQTGIEPGLHRVARGETAFQIARLYDVPVAALSEWNGLGSDLTVREGQQLLIPVAGATPPAQPAAAVSTPGEGTQTPTPPSAVVPLPEVDVTPQTPEVTTPAPDIGEITTPAPATSAPFIYPVQGSIIREYNPGRNEGIDINASAGTSVKAAAAGTIAAITQNTNGAQIIVVRHTGNILTVYVNVENLSVEKDDSVSQGQSIADVAAGSPAFLHFEVRDGLESVDPADYLP
ncbi:peptidoglycan DD-metalloendopeptidase family protein [Octadecabacter sp. 1_MG-2023]|uniref:peptidoglycan DD-metalloendopeptidase family protein n=1 Tax=unclassified Octadecabacter TaxID=196158 RepID=UPI001C089D30|nr:MULTISPECIES: peptidoglycan DD-metalloendopeptidase family protein [unclassified Octadecabacter]MBU2993781.1 peptidoglycan DD-metalloendopeptidase family protein [Octadecabacter sp. B2R22]MDO6735374.1 peptidoglycan DD-metalloendopeptidase family protein [Octadecabacter sp. 1_MG-2023]